MSNGDRPTAILIAGPTASGKSALALEVARALDGVVVNADSMQVYRDLAIITARPSEADMEAVPHALYGTVDGASNHSVQRWLADVERTLRDAAEAGSVPIIVGGSGLYLKALTQGLSDVPPVPDRVRAEVRAWVADRPPAALHAELARRDPVTARRLKPTDPQRLARALEVHIATGRGLAAYHEGRRPPLLDEARCAAFTLACERALLREHADGRFERMMKQGALNEVAALRERRLDPALPIMRAHGVAPLLDHLNGRLGLSEAIEVAKTDTRSYVKRQDTFFRHQLPRFRPIAPAGAAEAIRQAFQPGGRQS